MKKAQLKLVITALTVSLVLLGCGNGFDKQGVKNSNTTFKVYGNCGMCEKRIEGSLKGVSGISYADWDQTSKMIIISYESEKISIDEMKVKIAGVGYDTESHRAKESVYSKLPKCCQYERP